MTNYWMGSIFSHIKNLPNGIGPPHSNGTCPKPKKSDLWDWSQSLKMTQFSSWFCVNRKFCFKNDLSFSFGRKLVNWLHSFYYFENYIKRFLSFKQSIWLFALGGLHPILIGCDKSRLLFDTSFFLNTVLWFVLIVFSVLFSAFSFIRAQTSCFCIHKMSIDPRKPEWLWH